MAKVNRNNISYVAGITPVHFTCVVTRLNQTFFYRFNSLQKIMDRLLGFQRSRHSSLTGILEVSFVQVIQCIPLELVMDEP